eukprot:Skav234181  [mRNA]  locus=scaffold1377:82524:84517:- [translate_table: standard]
MASRALGYGGGGGLVTSGPVLESYGYRAACALAALPAAMVLLPELAAIRRRYFEQCEMLFLCIMMFAGVLVIMVVGLVQNDPRINFAVSFGISLFMLLCCSICLTPMVARANAFAAP